jgi:hypothetical protein
MTTDHGAAEAPAAAPLVIVDRWVEPDRFTLAAGSGENDLEFADVSEQELRSHPQIAAAKDIVVFDDAVTACGLPGRRTAVLSRIAATQRAFSDAPDETTLILCVGREAAVAGLVSEGRLGDYGTVGELSLDSVWSGFKSANPLLERLVQDNPEREPEVFADFRAALQGEFSPDGFVPFHALPDLAFLAPLLAGAIERFDPYGQASCLVLSGWAATDGLLQATAAARDQGPGIRMEMRHSADGMRDAFRGACRLLVEVEPLRRALAAVLKPLHAKGAGVDKVRLDRIEACARALILRHNCPDAHIGFLAEIERSGVALPPAIDPVLECAGVARFSRASGEELDTAGLAAVEPKGAQLPSNLSEILAAGGTMQIARLLESGVRRRSDERVLKKPVVEMKVVEPLHWALVSDTRKRLAAAGEPFAAALDGAMKLESLPPERFCGLLDALEEHPALCRRWLAYLRMERFSPDAVAPGGLVPGVRVANSDKVRPRGWRVEKVLQSGYRMAQSGRVVRDAVVEVSSSLDRLIGRTRALQLDDAAARAAVDAVADGKSPSFKDHDWFVRLLRSLAGIDAGLKNAWLEEFGLEEFLPAGAPESQVDTPGIRTRSARTTWVAPTRRRPTDAEQLGG